MKVLEEKVRKAFDRYADDLKSRSYKWIFQGDSKRGDKRIQKFITYFFLPIQLSDVIAFLDTTIWRTGKEGYLVTGEGIVVKEVANKLYYLEFDKIDHAEVYEETDELYRVTRTLFIYFKDGTRRQIFDYYINRNVFADMVNEIVLTKEAAKEFSTQGEKTALERLSETEGKPSEAEE